MEPTVAAVVTDEDAYTLHQEPGCGRLFFYDLFDDAKSSIDVVSCQLADDTATEHLVAASEP